VSLVKAQPPLTALPVPLDSILTSIPAHNAVELNPIVQSAIPPLVTFAN
jgi:hypothetical protein